MDDALEILALVLAACGAALGAYWLFGLGQLWRTLRTLPTARAGIALADAREPSESVCVVIPAYNEHRVIVGLIESLRAQNYANMRVVLVLDRCTDNTEELSLKAIGGDPRFTVTHVSECAEGWTGKVHAAYCAVHDCGVLNSDYLLFADADTLFDPGCVRAAVALMRDRKLDFMSLISELRHRKWYERLVQPACALELMRQYPLVRANRFQDRRAFGNGQFLMFTRDGYVRCGEHREVRTELLEDIRFARVAEYMGLRAGIFLADGMLMVRMYQTWQEFRKGWKRIFVEAANRRPERLRRFGWGVRAMGTALPLGAAAGAAAGLLSGGAWGIAAAAVSLAGLAIWLFSSVLITRLGGWPLVSGFTFPFGSWVVGAIMIEAARDLESGTPTVWGGRAYDRRLQPGAVPPPLHSAP